MFNYTEFLESVDKEAYHAGEFQWQEDGFDVYRSYPWSPPGCHDSCGCLFYLKDGLLDHVEGDPLSPVVNGRLCIRCLDMPEATNNPDRIIYPMRRVGERGENKWERISWDEALDEVCEKVKFYHSTYGPQSIMVSRGTGRDISWGAGWLAYMSVQTPIHDMLCNVAWSCYTPRVLSSNGVIGDYWVADASMGHEDRYNNPEWRPPGVLIVWANEPLKSNGDGYMGHWLVPCVQQGTKIISVDPRLTWWGARADYFLQLRPGTDAALAMAMINVIITEEIYDKDFVEKWCYGFNELAESIAWMTPEEAGAICDLNPDDIRGAARLFATEGPGTVQWGLPLEQQPNSLSNNLAIMELIAICGYIDCPGGAVIVRDAFGFPHKMGEAYLPKEIMATRPQKVAPDAIWGETRQPRIDWEAGSDNRIRMIFFQSCNTLGNAAGDPGRLYDAMQSIEYAVGIDPVMNPTISAFADIVLPVSMSIERDSIRSWWTPLRAISKLTQYHECKTDEDIAIEIGNRLRPGAYGYEKGGTGLHNGLDLCNWRLTGKDPTHDKSQSSVDARTAEDDGSGQKVFSKESNMQVLPKETWPTDKDFSVLQSVGYKYDTFCGTYYKYEKGMLRADDAPGFNTTTGRVELYSLMFMGWGTSPLPEWFEPAASPVATPELFEKYPLILNSGVRSYEFFHGEHRNLPTMRELHPWPLVCMNQTVADHFGIKEGDWTWIENDQGRFKQVAHIVSTMKNYVISAESGWWYPEEDAAAPTLFRTFDSNPNNCVSVEKIGPYGVGSQGKVSLVTIYPVKEGDITPTEQVLQRGGFPEQKARREDYQAQWVTKGKENS